MDQIGNTEVNSSEDKSPLLSSPTQIISSSEFDSQSVDSAQPSSSCEIRATSELRALDESCPSFADSIHEEVTGAYFLMEKIQIPHILLTILRLLDKESLRQARLVSRKWNNLALEILSKTAGTVEFCLEGGNCLDTNELELARINKLLSILSLTKYPGMFFTKLILAGSIPYREQGVLVQETHLLNLLSKFGSTLKSLELREITLHLSVLRPLLDMWCVNLEELTLDEITVVEDKGTSVQSFGTSPTPLTLNLRKIRCQETGGFYSHNNLFLSIIKGSPKLQSLHGCVVEKESDFWGTILSLPSITKTLEEVIIGTGEDQDISWLNGISFCNKLTSLILDIRDPRFPKEQLFECLETVAESLEKFALHMNSLQYPFRGDYWGIQLPLMTKLKVLEHSFDFSAPAGFHSIDLLKMTPNLEILRMACNIAGYPIDDERVDAFFLDSSYLIFHPSTKLNSLFIKGSPKRLETIPSINRMFPNLRELLLHFDMGEIPETTEKEIPETTEKETWLTSNFKSLSEMKNLKVLKVNFHEEYEFDFRINFENCFSPLEASKSLEELTISRYHKQYVDIPILPDFPFVPPEFEPHRQDFPPGLEKTFLKIPNLKLLALPGFQIGSSDSRILFNEKGVLLSC